jgi:hypothetical protein
MIETTTISQATATTAKTIASWRSPRWAERIASATRSTTKAA